MKSASIFTLTLLAALPVRALNLISWVSHSGSDTNTCTITSPCRTFQRAYNVTNSGGIVKAMDAGEYGPVTITNPISIDGNGVGASIDVVAGGMYPAGVFLYFPVGRVEIRSLAIHVDPNCSFCDGIDAYNNVSLSIEDVSVTGQPQNGVAVQSGTATIRGVSVSSAYGNGGIVIGDATAVISDSVIRNTSGGAGIDVFSSTAVTRVLIQRTRMLANFRGLLVNFTSGFAATAWISDCVISGNTTGTTGGGQIITLRNNTWLGNSTDGSTPFSISLK
jgi:hypothetical protein